LFIFFLDNYYVAIIDLRQHSILPIAKKYCKIDFHADRH